MLETFGMIGNELLNERRGIVGGAIVDNDQLQSGIGLVTYRCQAS